MKFKMAKNSLFAILLRSPWWISIAIVVVFTLASIAVLPKEYVGFGVMGGLPFLVIGLMAARKQWGAPSSAKVAEALAQVGTLTWKNFSDQIERMYAQQGYAVTRLHNAKADYQLDKGGQTWLVSCKRWKAANHGVEVLRDLVAAKDTLGAQHGIYLSLVPVSDTAKRFAAAQGITLLAGDDLGRFLLEKPKR